VRVGGSGFTAEDYRHQVKLKVREAMRCKAGLGSARITPENAGTPDGLP
jgi:hypothetical protein